MKLTDKQREFLVVMAELSFAANKPPTVQEICDKLGLRSKNAAVGYLNALIKKGCVSKTCKGKAHTYQVIGLRYTWDYVSTEGYRVFNVVNPR